MSSCSNSYQYQVFTSEETQDPGREAFLWLLSRVNDVQAVQDAAVYFVPCPQSQSMHMSLRWFNAEAFAREYSLAIPGVTVVDWRGFRVGRTSAAVVRRLSDPVWLHNAECIETPFALVETTAVFTRSIVACYDFRETPN